MGKGKSPNNNDSKGIYGILIAMGIGLIIVFLSALNSGWLSISIGLLVAGASIMAGGLLGFLFGIPRSLQISELTGGQADKTDKGAYKANTNLEQISDWLTKILVGVGLTQLTKVPEKLNDLAKFLSPGFGGTPQSEIMAVTIVLLFSISGFLFGYLYTRLFVGEQLRKADDAALGEMINDEIGKQMSQDARALTLVQQHLNPRNDTRAVSYEELSDAIAKASPEEKTTIFYQAMEIRNQNWQNNKEKMERTIPVFQALVDSDKENLYHKNHGQLGFALKDKKKPDWEDAEKELNTAIRIRGDSKTHGWLYYEFNRAICRINLELLKGTTGLSPYHDQIIADLKEVYSKSELQKLIEEDQTIMAWMNRNNVKLDDLNSN